LANRKEGRLETKRTEPKDRKVERQTKEQEPPEKGRVVLVASPIPIPKVN